MYVELNFELIVYGITSITFFLSMIVAATLRGTKQELGNYIRGVLAIWILGSVVAYFISRLVFEAIKTNLS